MAKKVITTVELTDDLDGGRGDQTISFAFEGTNYEIDLSKKNATALTKVLRPYVDAARKVRGSSAARTSAGTRTRSRNDLGEIRQWAKDNGHSVSERGRIAKEIQDAYDAAH